MREAYIRPFPYGITTSFIADQDCLMLQNTRNDRIPAVLAAVVTLGSLVLFDPWGWHPFGPVKWLVLTPVAWLAAGHVLHHGVRLHRPSVVTWSLFLLWAMVTSVLAVDPLSAWLGTPDRRFGVIAVATLAAAFVTGQAVTDQAGRRFLCRTTSVALVLMAMYGGLELAGVAPVELTTTTDRLGSTLGSAAYLGAALCLLLPVAVSTAADRAEASIWRGLAGLAVAGAVFLLVGSSTRAAFVGLGVAALFSARRWWGGLRRSTWVAAGVIAVAGLVLVVTLPQAERLTRSGVEDRLAEWSVGVDTFADHPLTGTGLDGYRVAFPAYVDTAYVQQYGRDTVTDRAHSGPLDLGIMTGLPGMAFWVVAAAWLTAQAWKAVRQQDIVVAAIAAGVVAWLAQQALLFPTVEVGTVGCLMAGVLVSATAEPQRPTRSRLAAVVAVLVAVVTAVGGSADVVADRRAAAARFEADPALASGAASLRPDSFRYPLLAADLALDGGQTEVAWDRLQEAVRLSPHDPGLRIAQARVVAARVAAGELPASEAAVVVEDLIGSDPHHPVLRMLQGEILAVVGDAQGAEHAWLSAGHLSPGDAEPLLRLAELYHAAGEENLAHRVLADARERQPDHPRLDAMEELLDGS